MPCFLLLIILTFPRIALVLMWVLSTYLQRAFHDGLVLPVLGFIFLPLTTIVYAWELNSGSDSLRADHAPLGGRDWLKSAMAAERSPAAVQKTTSFRDR
jgi:hypothetical protein